MDTKISSAELWDANIYLNQSDMYYFYNRGLDGNKIFLRQFGSGVKFYITMWKEISTLVYKILAFDHKNEINLNLSGLKMGNDGLKILCDVLPTTNLRFLNLEGDCTRFCIFCVTEYFLFQMPVIIFYFYLKLLQKTDSSA